MVSDLIPIPSRRQFLRQTTFLAAAFATRGAFADMLAPTPRLTEGPFYPDKLPLDTDNDLLILNDSLTPAVGEITYLTGRVLGPNGSPVRNAFVEIWQVDNNGAYLHTGDSRHELLDKNFQGYGRFLTDSEGRYSFRTIKPVPYPGRTPHIHLAVSRNGKRALTTQLLIKGHPQNERDGVFRALTDPAQRERLLVDFTPLPQSKLGELHAKFDVVLGVTPADDDDGLKGVAKPDRETGGGGRPPGGPGGRPPGPPPRN
uniref:Intradiol ring-cleavage dioxygenase n=1 Tax=Schlesneria paludicola TaxID=360056 RepID=A0A7C2JYV2_9PLAN